MIKILLSISDYASDAGLDQYSDTGLDDANEFEAMTLAQRRAAETEMARRDRAGGRRRGRRGARRAPGFIDDDDEDEDVDEEGGALRGIIPAGVKIRTRKQYDERQDVDDAAGAEDEEMPFEQLSDIKANSVAEWIAQPRVRKTIEKQFRHFLVTYVDEKSGTSVYGERIKTLGESS